MLSGIGFFGDLNLKSFSGLDKLAKNGGPLGDQKVPQFIVVFFAARKKPQYKKNAVTAQKCGKSETWLLTGEMPSNYTLCNMQLLRGCRLCHVTHQTFLC